MKIYVTIHPHSSPAALEMLKAFEHEARGRGVDVVTSTAMP